MFKLTTTKIMQGKRILGAAYVYYKKNQNKSKAFWNLKKNEMFKKKMKEQRCLDVDGANKMHSEML